MDPAADTGLEAAESDGDLPVRRLVSFNEYQGPHFSFRLGFGLLWDTAGYSQDADSEDQLDLVGKQDLRDFRLIGKGFMIWPRLTWTVGYMYDETNGGWVFRQTGLNLGLPELNGALFVGRTKENFSTNKIMVGYQGWTNERAAASDAFIPILADGVVWKGYNSSGTFLYSLGAFGDQLSEDEGFSKNDAVYTARAIWLPFTGKGERLLHLAAEYRYGTADEGFLQFRSKPEVYEAQTYAVDTGRFAANHVSAYGLEAYYRDGPFMLGSEYFFNQVSSDVAHNPFFHGGEIFVAYILTGETRPYSALGGYFERVSPAESVFDGGIGAWEAVLRFSYVDLDDQAIEGGKFWRITPVMNWHMSDNVRLELASGYGELDRFGVKGGTVFVQTRIQFQL